MDVVVHVNACILLIFYNVANWHNNNILRQGVLQDNLLGVKSLFSFLIVVSFNFLGFPLVLTL